MGFNDGPIHIINYSPNEWAKTRRRNILVGLVVAIIVFFLLLYSTKNINDSISPENEGKEVSNSINENININNLQLSKEHRDAVYDVFLINSGEKTQAVIVFDILQYTPKNEELSYQQKNLIIIDSNSDVALESFCFPPQKETLSYFSLSNQNGIYKCTMSLYYKNGDLKDREYTQFFYDEGEGRPGSTVSYYFIENYETAKKEFQTIGKVKVGSNPE